MYNHCAAEIDHTQRKRTSGIEIKRRGQHRFIVNPESFLDSVVDAVKNKSPMSRQTSFWKTCCARGQHDDEWIIFAHWYRRLAGALTGKQSTETDVGGNRGLDKTQVMRLLRLLKLLDATFLENQR